MFKFKFVLIFSLIVGSLQLFGQGGTCYNKILEEIESNPNCTECSGRGIKHNTGIYKTRAHRFCHGQGCYDCDYKGTERYKGAPFDFTCGTCEGTGKNPLSTELKNLDKLRKIYIEDHAPYVVLYHRGDDGFNRPDFGIEYDEGRLKFLLYNEETQRVFDQFGNPLWDIGFESDRIVDFFYCGANSIWDKAAADLMGSPNNSNRKNTSTFVVGSDFTKDNGARLSGSDFNVTVRYSHKIKSPQFPLTVNAVSFVEWQEGYFNQKILDRYIVMMFATIVYNTTWYNSGIFSHTLNTSMQGLIDY